MFRDDLQLAQVCNALTERLGKGRFWDIYEVRPGDFRAELNDLGQKIARRMPGFSPGEIIVLRVAFNLWNDSWKSPAFGDVVHRLDSGHLRRIATLMLAIDQGGLAIDRWLTENERRLTTSSAAPEAPE